MYSDISENERLTVSFTPYSEVIVSLLLSRETQGVDLHLQDELLNIDWWRWPYFLNESLVFPALANVAYQLRESAATSSARFELNVVQANRESLQLEANEFYIVSVIVSYEDRCQSPPNSANLWQSAQLCQLIHNIFITR
jgi:hypothetical protein